MHLLFHVQTVSNLNLHLNIIGVHRLSLVTLLCLHSFSHTHTLTEAQGLCEAAGGGAGEGGPRGETEDDGCRGQTAPGEGKVRRSTR